MRRSFYIFFALILLFAIIVIIWLFFFSSSAPGRIVTEKPNPLPGSEDVSIFRLPKIFGDDEKEEGGSFEITPGEKQVLVRVWDKPVAGYSFVERQILEQVASTTVSGSTTIPAIEQVRATTSSLFFVDRMTGYVHQYDKKTGQVSQVTNTLVPGVYDALFLSNGRFVVYRSYDEKRGVVVSSLFRIPLTTLSSGPISMEKLADLPDNVVSIAVNRRGNQFAFITKTTSGGALYVSTEDQANSFDPFPQSKITAIPLPLYEWDLAYGGNTLYMTPKASAYIPGYTIEASSGRRIVSNRTGLVSIASPDGKQVFSTMFSQSGLVSFFTDTNTGNGGIVQMRTIASKCSFDGLSLYVLCGVPEKIPLKRLGYPDDWYQGVAQFSDFLYRTYPDGALIEVLNLKQEAGEEIDITKPITDSRSSLFVFTNKKKGDLWAVNLDLLSGDY